MVVLQFVGQRFGSCLLDIRKLFVHGGSRNRSSITSARVSSIAHGGVVCVVCVRVLLYYCTVLYSPGFSHAAFQRTHTHTHTNGTVSMHSRREYRTSYCTTSTVVPVPVVASALSSSRSAGQHRVAAVRPRRRPLGKVVPFVGCSSFVHTNCVHEMAHSQAV